MSLLACHAQDIELILQFVTDRDLNTQKIIGKFMPVDSPGLCFANSTPLLYPCRDVPKLASKHINQVLGVISMSS